MRILLAAIFITLSVNGVASHIVGGNFEIKHQFDVLYRLNLFLYADAFNGSPDAKDLQISVKIFRNIDGALIRTEILTLENEEALLPTQLGCGSFTLSILKWTYSTLIVLNPEIFNHPDGYYVAWERCCRNYTLSNIYSEDPNAGQASGLAFYLEFPPVIKDGSLLINSSPSLLPPMEDYACLGRPFVADFGATDPDGDSLVYSIVTPWSTHTAEPIPVTAPKPYPYVIWREPFNLQNIMGGNPDIQINDHGLLTVTPTTVGLFCFAVQCDEYRNHIKIGQVRREYQILTQECETSKPPVIQAKSLNGSYSSDADFSITFDETTGDEERCFKIRVEDGDITTPGTLEHIKLRVMPVGFHGDISTILPSEPLGVLTYDQPFVEFPICFDRCSPTESNTFTVAIIASDDDCSQPLMDTLFVHVTLPELPGCHFQSITFPAILDKTLGDDPFRLNATASSGLPVEYAPWLWTSDSRISITDSLVTLKAAGKVWIVATQPGDENYQKAVPVTQQFCINPKPPVISWTEVDGQMAFVSTADDGTLWYRDGALLPLESKVWLPPAGDSASYFARVIVGECLSVKSNAILIDLHPDEVVTAAEPTLRQPIDLFPNPTEDEITIRLPRIAKDSKIELIGVRGETKMEFPVVDEEGVSISMKDFPPGLYVLRITNGNSVQVRKIVKR